MKTFKKKVKDVLIKDGMLGTESVISDVRYDGNTLRFETRGAIQRSVEVGLVSLQSCFKYASGYVGNFTRSQECVNTLKELRKEWEFLEAVKKHVETLPKWCSLIWGIADVNVVEEGRFLTFLVDGSMFARSHVAINLATGEAHFSEKSCKTAVRQLKQGEATSALPMAFCDDLRKIFVPSKPQAPKYLMYTGVGEMFGCSKGDIRDLTVGTSKEALFINEGLLKHPDWRVLTPLETQLQDIANSLPAGVTFLEYGLAVLQEFGVTEGGK